MTRASTSETSLPRFWTLRSALLAFAVGSVATLLLFLSRTGERDPFAMLDDPTPARWVIALVSVTLLSLWGFWSWPRIRARCAGEDGPLIFRTGVLGWGGAMLLLSSWNEATYLVTGPDRLGIRSFLAEVLLRAVIGWPIWAWLGYWFGVITIRAVRGLYP